MVTLLLTTSLLAIAEDEPEVITGAGKDASIQEIDTKKAGTVTNQNLKQQQEKSVKMIVGGQSEDGVAKETIVPVKE